MTARGLRARWIPRQILSRPARVVIEPAAQNVPSLRTAAGMMPCMDGVTELVFETHSLSEDNERGVATGWHDGRLSSRGRELARELGERRRDDGIEAVFASDLGRAVETATIAFRGSDIPVMYDWRVRECDYGRSNGTLAADLHADRTRYLDEPYPDGESWREAVARVNRFLGDIPLRWDGYRVLVIGHVATRWGFDHFINGDPLDQLLVADFGWREGWEYRPRSRG